jgi:hypothetical protein
MRGASLASQYGIRLAYLEIFFESDAWLGGSLDSMIVIEPFRGSGRYAVDASLKRCYQILVQPKARHRDFKSTFTSWTTLAADPSFTNTFLEGYELCGKHNREEYKLKIQPPVAPKPARWWIESPLSRR